MHLAINFTFEQGHEVVHGRNAHTIGSFSTIKCSCKSKSHIVTNFPMRPCAISNVELAGYEVHAVTASAPALGLTLFGRTAFDDQGTWTVCSPPTSLRECKPAPFQKFHQLLGNDRQTVIGELETLSVAVSLMLWGPSVASSKLLIYIDNEGSP